jgi:predicted ATP-grasp superfamily ATP-dependent carboligase
MQNLHNIEKNWSRPGYHGWDAGGRLWQISKDKDHRRGWKASNGEKWLYAATLKVLSETLAVTSSYNPNRTFPT